MEEIIKIIDIKCNRFENLKIFGKKIYKGWFYDFAEILLQQGYTQEQIENTINQMICDECIENMSKNGMIKYFGNVQYAIDNEKAFFEYVKNKLNTKKQNYFEEGLQYARQHSKSVGNFIDAFIKYVVITNFEDLQLKYKDLIGTEHGKSMEIFCCLGNFDLGTMLCEAETDKVYFDEVHTRKNLTGTKIGEVMFRKLFKMIHDDFPNKDLYTLRLLKKNEGAKRFYERMGGIVYDYGSESDFGVVYKKEDLEELSKKIIIPPSLYSTQKEEFLDRLKLVDKMNLEIKKLIETGTIICGKIINENGIIRFKRVEPSQIEGIPENERGFATASMGRAIFTIDKDGSIHNFKGVDSHLSTSELGPMNLVNGKSIEYIPGANGYKVSAVVFHGKKPEIRINGTSPFEDIEIEGDINKRLAEIGIKVPTISYIKEIPQDFSIKYGLPIKVDGSLNEFESDYAVEDDERKKRLGEIYGSNYSQELVENQRPESMREYLQRIGFLSSPEIQTNIEALGYSMQDFIEAVDRSYSRGQRYGQAERIMGSPFRVSDLETCIANGNIEQLQTIMDFSEMQNNNFAEQLAEIFGKNIALLINNGWECENLIHRQDFSLAGEFCDDAYFDIFEKKEEMQGKYKAEPYKADALMNEIRRKYTGQVMHIASCIKVVQNAMSMIGKNQEQIDSILETFVERFTNNLDLQKIGQLFQIDEKQVVETLINEFRTGQNWTEKMARQNRKDSLAIDEAIYNSHIENEIFYAKVSGMISEQIETKLVQKDTDRITKNNKNNPVQSYLDEINKIQVPNDERNILDFLGSLDSNIQKDYLSFILSQSHIFDSMTAILDTYNHKDFYHEAGYSDRTGNVVPKLDKNGRVYYEEYTSSDSTDNACKAILRSLQGNDKQAWEKFVKYLKSIYEPTKMDIYHNPQLHQLNQDIREDFVLLSAEIIENDRLKGEISKLRNMPVQLNKGFINRIKGFFSQRKRDKELRRKESVLQDEDIFPAKALALIEKYKSNKNISNVMRNQLEFAEGLIKAGLPKKTFINILNGLGHCAESASYCNYRIFDMLKQLSINATIGKKLYSPEILYATSFQDMTKNIRKLLAKNDLKENSPITTEYRTEPLRNTLLASEDISNVLKGKNLSQQEIQAKMIEYDEEFKNILEEKNAETYIKRCTNLMMKFISTHPFDDGNGRTARMLLQAMLARKGIIFPSNIDNYFERQSGTDYSTMENTCLRTENYTQMGNYILERAKKFNNGELVLNDEPLTFEYNDRQNSVGQSQLK